MYLVVQCEEASNSTTLLTQLAMDAEVASKNPQNHRGDREVRGPRPHSWKNDTRKRFGKFKEQLDRSLVHFANSQLKAAQCEQRFPSSTLQTRLRPSIPSLGLTLPQPLPPSNHKKYVTLWGIKKNIVTSRCTQESSRDTCRSGGLVAPSRPLQTPSSQLWQTLFEVFPSLGSFQRENVLVSAERSILPASEGSSL